MKHYSHSEGQMQMDFNCVEPTSKIEALMNKYGTTEDALDKKADILGSYHLAYRHFKVPPEEVAHLLDPITEVDQDIVDYTAPEMIEGISVNLAERAGYLIKARTELCHYSSRRGLVNSYDDGNPELTKRFDDHGISRAWQNADTSRRIGFRAFSAAYGPQEDLIKAGFDASADEAHAESEFMRVIIGPENEKNRNKLNRVWKKQIKAQQDRLSE